MLSSPTALEANRFVLHQGGNLTGNGRNREIGNLTGTGGGGAGVRGWPNGAAVIVAPQGPSDNLKYLRG